MYQNLLLLIILCTTAESASYQRYDENSQYSTYPSYTTANPYNTYQYKSGVSSLGSDIAKFPEATRYPNYSPGYSTSTQRSEVFYTPSYNNGGSYNTAGSYNTGDSYNTGNSYNTGVNYNQGYGQGVGTGFGNGYGNSFSSFEVPFMNNMRDYCINRSPQVGIWVESLMGMWYGVEFIEHLGVDSRIDKSRTCIVVHISEPMDQPTTEYQSYHVQHINARFRQEYRHIRLLWDEAGNTIEYSLYFKNDTAGYWQVFNPQNGTRTVPPNNYQQFSGTIQVLKAVSDHLVLNFCQEGINGRSATLFSVLFSREPGVLEIWERDSVHSMLQNKKLSIASRRMVCGNSADRPWFSFGIIIILLLTYTVHSSLLNL